MYTQIFKFIINENGDELINTRILMTNRVQSHVGNSDEFEVHARLMRRRFRQLVAAAELPSDFIVRYDYFSVLII